MQCLPFVTNSIWALVGNHARCYILSFNVKLFWFILKQEQKRMGSTRYLSPSLLFCLRRSACGVLFQYISWSAHKGTGWPLVDKGALLGAMWLDLYFIKRILILNRILEIRAAVSAPFVRRFSSHWSVTCLKWGNRIHLPARQLAGVCFQLIVHSPRVYSVNI